MGDATVFQGKFTSHGAGRDGGDGVHDEPVCSYHTVHFDAPDCGDTCRLQMERCISKIVELRYAC